MIEFRIISEEKNLAVKQRTRKTERWKAAQLRFIRDRRLERGDHVVSPSSFAPFLFTPSLPRQSFVFGCCAPSSAGSTPHILWNTKYIERTRTRKNPKIKRDTDRTWESNLTSTNDTREYTIHAVLHSPSSTFPFLCIQDSTSRTVTI